MPLGGKRRRAKKNRKDSLILQELAILTVILSLIDKLIEIVVLIIKSRR